MSIFNEIHSGYKGSPEKWQQFLLAWSNKRKELGIMDEFLNFNNDIWCKKEKLVSHGEFIPPLVNIEQVKQEILFAEQRLEFKLPKSYCDFMLATEAKVPHWCFESYSPHGKMLSLQEIDRAKYICPELVGYEVNGAGELVLGEYQLSKVEIPEDYPDPELFHLYNSEQDCIDCLPSLVEAELLQLTIEEGEGFALMLNYNERTSDGELQGYMLDHKAPGAYRFTSFAQMMMCIYMREMNYDDYEAWFNYKKDPYGIAKILFE